MVPRPASASVPAHGAANGISAAFPGGPDAVEAALADALARASQAGQWSVVAQLARELEARRFARSEAVDLEAERRRRLR